jgi:glutamate racemase
MDENDYLLFIDSGMGGISILKNFLSAKERTNIIFYADTKNFPYGEKDEKTIGDILYNIYTSIFSNYSISMIVIACNTASVTALKFLREKVKIPIIGTVPAIKPASQQTKNNRIGIIATETTSRGKYLIDLVNKFASDKEVFIKPCQQLVTAAENVYSNDKLKNVFEKELSELKKKDIDTLVLGCTHYSLIKEEINNYFETKVNILDSVEGVTKRILQLLDEKAKLSGNKRLLFLSEGKEEIMNKYIKINKKFNIFNDIINGDLICRKD